MNCKPGVLAFVIRDDFPENVGRVVEVLEAAEEPNDGCGFWWLVRFEGAPGPYSLPESPGVVEGFDVECEMLDSNLFPISGVPLDDEAPIETDIGEALRLGLGIESRWSA